MFLKDLRSRNFEYSDMWLTGSLQQEDGLVSQDDALVVWTQFLPRTTVFLELEAAVITSSTAPLVNQLYNAFLIGSPSAFFPV